MTSSPTSYQKKNEILNQRPSSFSDELRFIFSLAKFPLIPKSREASGEPMSVARGRVGDRHYKNAKTRLSENEEEIISRKPRE